MKATESRVARIAVLAVSIIAVSAAEAKQINDPAVKGSYYEAEVPDTLDLAERARLGLNHFTESIREELGHEMIMGVTFSPDRSVGVAMHMTGLGCCQAKCAEAMAMLRIASGSQQHLAREAKMLEMMVSNIGEEGIWWVPQTTGKPWLGAAGYVPYANTHGQGRMLRAMTAWYQYSGDARWKTLIDRMVDGMDRVFVVHKDDYAYVPTQGWMPDEYFRSSYVKGRGWKDTAEPTSEKGGEEGSLFNHQANLAGPLATWYRLSGNKQALRLAGEMVRFLMKPKFWADFPGGDYPGVVGAEHAHWQGHFHGHVNALRSILDYAVVTNDSRLKAFVRDGYEWSRQAQGGIPVIGQVGDGQGCGIGRLIGLAVKLSYHGVGDYWEDVDQYIRNHAVEYQITAKDVLRMIGKADLDAGEYELPQDVLRKLGPGNLPAASGLPGITAADVIRAAIGEIPGSASKTASWQCCGSHGNMSFFYAWDGALRHSDGVVRVNLLLNRASPWMDVDSYLPFEGKVVLKNRAAQEAFVRIPFWVEKKSVECRMGTEVVRSKWLGRYLRFENLKPLDVLTITFPMAERTEKWTRPLTVQPPAISDGKLAMPGLLAALVDGVDRKDVKVSVDAQSNSEAVLILRHKDHKFLLAVYVPGSGIYFHEYRNDAYGPPLARVDPGQFGPNIHLTAEAKGSEIMLTVADGKRSVSTHHSIEHIHQSGTVGLYHNHTPTQMFDNFVASDPEGKMIFEDRFDGPNGPYTKWHNAFGDGKWEENIGTLKFKGNTLIEASPPMSPLYDGRSEKYRASNAPMRKVTRYVTSQVLEW